LSGYIFATKARIDNHKKVLSSNIPFKCPHNMVNFGPLTAKIGSGVWGTPANFNWFRVLARHSGVRQPNFAALNRGRHLCSAWRPSRWALAHILVMAAMHSRCGHYIFALWFLLSSSFFLSFFPRLISAVGYWMSTILPHMVWP